MPEHAPPRRGKRGSEPPWEGTGDAWRERKAGSGAPRYTRMSRFFFSSGQLHASRTPAGQAKQARDALSA